VRVPLPSFLTMYATERSLVALDYRLLRKWGQTDQAALTGAYSMLLSRRPKLDVHTPAGGRYMGAYKKLENEMRRAVEHGRYRGGGGMSKGKHKITWLTTYCILWEAVGGVVDIEVPREPPSDAEAATEVPEEAIPGPLEAL